MAKVKTLKKNQDSHTLELLSMLPNFHKTGNATGMKQKYYGKDALLVKNGNYIYNCTSEPTIYNYCAE
jgi:hypothetical protein